MYIEIIPLYDTGIVTWWGTAGDESTFLTVSMQVTVRVREIVHLVLYTPSFFFTLLSIVTTG